MPLIPDPPKTQTIEQTGKNLKAQILLAWGLVIVSILLGSLLYAPYPQWGETIFWGGISCGLLLHFATRFQIWWHHK